MVECGCEEEDGVWRVKCRPKNEAERALEVRHGIDCVQGCLCEEEAEA